MLGHLKINNNDSMNTLMSLKQGNDNSGIRSGSQDFYSMVMDNNREISGRETGVKNSVVDTVSQNSFNENTKQAERKTESLPENSDRKTAEHQSEKTETSVRAAENDEKSVKKNKSEDADKEKKIENRNKDEREIDDFLKSAAGEMLTKKITDLVRGSGKENTEDFLKKFSKLAEEILSAAKKKMSKESGFNFSFSTDKTSLAGKNSAVLTEFVNKLGREIAKFAAGKKGDEKTRTFSEKDIREALNVIIDDIKKGRNRNTDKPELKRTDHDEVRNDRKNEIAGEQVLIKRKENSNDSAFDLNSGKDKNANREGSLPSSGRIDSVNRNGFEKNEQIMKSPEFRQSLQEIIDKAKISVRDNNNATFSVRLFPKDLGSVNVNILMENGVVSGRFLVESDEAKSLLMNNLGELREQLAEAGIQLGEFNVNVNQGGERFAAKEKEDENIKTLNQTDYESESAMMKYDYNSSAAHNGHINMVI